MTGDPRKPFWAKCKPCGHCWPIAYLPLEVSAVVKAGKRATCPMCAATGKEIGIAKQDDGKLLEPTTEKGLI